MWDFSTSCQLFWIMSSGELDLIRKHDVQWNLEENMSVAADALTLLGARTFVGMVMVKCGSHATMNLCGYVFLYDHISNSCEPMN